ncbi:zinc-ribbon domain-containing protein [Sporobacter termitidis DSM 10068]|uniref:Zinc-ribbon domain-containing protein n=1 Tax=Sporobacter termitidis DSM 10068 TaxID=1123282 RepID=A0A1M5WMI4_9FIRM|nr:hypothetical protein [Sporobacter termitidis]SHH88223.1 zinc-ribbon domain-containing protein [Sporobacter termitidis DSM 10068]
MAMVTCPKCKRIVNDTSKKCPNCGGPLGVGTGGGGSIFDKNAPKFKKLHLLSNVFLAVSCLLLLLEFGNVGKTYVGGVLFGVGFLLQGLSEAAREKEPGYVGKGRSKLIIGISVVLTLVGCLYFYLDLR